MKCGTDANGKITNPPEIAENIVRRIVKGIALHQGDVEVGLAGEGTMPIVNVRVNRGDMSRLIGKAGAHSRALEVVVAAISAKYGVPVRVFIQEPTTGMKDRYGGFAPNLNWNSAPLMMLLSDVCDACFSRPTTLDVQDMDVTSTFTVRVDMKEQQPIVQAVSVALGILFNAIGRASGRIVAITVEYAAAS